MDYLKTDSFLDFPQLVTYFEVLNSYYLGVLCFRDILFWTSHLPFYFELRLGDFIFFDAL